MEEKNELYKKIYSEIFNLTLENFKLKSRNEDLYKTVGHLVLIIIFISLFALLALILSVI